MLRYRNPGYLWQLQRRSHSANCTTADMLPRSVIGLITSKPGQNNHRPSTALYQQDLRGPTRYPYRYLLSLLLMLSLLAGLAPTTWAQDTTPSLMLDPARVMADSFDGGGTVTITLIPQNATFLGAGGDDGGGGRQERRGGGSSTYFLNGDLTDAGKKLIELSGEPAGLMIDDIRLLALQSGPIHGIPDGGDHRSVAIDLSYSGATIMADDIVTVNVDRVLLRQYGVGTFIAQNSDLAADFTITVAPGLLILSDTLSVRESGGMDSYTVALDTEPTGNVQISVTSDDPLAATVQGPTGAAGSMVTLTFSTENWNEPQVVTVTGVNDGVENTSRERTVTINHQIADGDGERYISSDTVIESVMVTVTDDISSVTITESGDSTTVSEVGSTDSYTVVLDTEPAGDVHIMTTSPINAAAVTPSTLTFTTGNWNQPQAVTVMGINDNMAISDNSRMATITHAISIGDGDGYPVGLSIDSVAVTVLELITATLTRDTGDSIGEGQTLTYTITLSRTLTTGQTLTLPLAFTGTAARNTDYWVTIADAAGVSDDDFSLNPRMSANIEFTAGSSTAILTLYALTDFVTDPDETVHIVWGSSEDITGTNLPLPPTLVEDDADLLTISDTPSVTVSLDINPEEIQMSDFNSDGMVTLTLIPQNVSFANVGNSTNNNGDGDEVGLGSQLEVHEFSLITLSGLPGLSIERAAFTAIDSSGRHGVPSHTSLELTLSYSGSGISSDQQVVVTVSPEMLRRVISENEARRYRGEPLATTFTVRNDIPRVNIAVPEGSITVSEAGDAQAYLMALNTQPADNVIVTATSGDPSRATVQALTGGSPGDTAALTFTTENWNEQQIVLVTGVDDGIDDAGSRTTVITHRITTDDGDSYTAAALDIDDVMVTVTPDTRPVINLSSATYNVDEGNTLTVTVELSATLGTDLNFDVSVSDSGQTASSGTDVSATTVSGVITAGETSAMVGIQTLEDADDERDETFSMMLTHSSEDIRDGETLSATATIIDDDPTTVTLGGGGPVSSNRQDSVQVTVILSRRLYAGETVTVPLTVTGARITPTDYRITLPDTSFSLNSGVTLNTSGPHSTAEPAVVFDGHDSNTVQEATLLVAATEGFASAGVEEQLNIGFGSGARAVMSNLDRASGTGADGTTATGSASVTITNNDAAALILSRNLLSVTEGTNDSYTVTLAARPTANVNVEVSILGDSGADLTLDDTSLTFTTANWDTAQTVMVTVGQDDDGMDNILLLQHIGAGGGYDLASAAIITVMVIDDDEAGVTVMQSGGDTTVSEDGTVTDNYTVVLDTQPVADVVITMGIEPATAAAVNPTSLTFTTADWRTPKPVAVTGLNDDIDNPGNVRTATIAHTISTGDGVEYGSDNLTINSITVTVTDDDDPTVNFNLSEIEASEQTAGIEGSLTVTVENPQPIDLNIGYTISTGSTATSGTDYTGLSGSVTIPAGESSAAIDITIIDDRIDDDDETIILMLSDGTGYVTRGSNTVTITIADNDMAALLLAPSSLTVIEESNAGYTVALATEPTDSVTISITGHSSAGLNLSGAGLSGSSLTFTTGNWDQTRMITIMARDDDDSQNSEAILTHRANGGGYDSVVGNITVNITDNDAPGLVVEPTTLTVNEGSDTGYTIQLATRPAGDVTVTVNIQADSDLIANDPELTFTVGNWNQAQTVTITAGPDDDAVDDTAVMLSHTAAGGGYNSVAANVEVNTRDSDTAELILEPTGLTINENSRETYTVILATEPTANVTVSVTGQAGTDLMLSGTGLNGSSLTFTRRNWNETQTVTVMADEDLDGNDDGPITLSHRADGGDYSGLMSGLEVTIIDNDVPGVATSPNNLEVSESAGVAIYTVRLNTRPDRDVVITATSDTVTAAMVDTDADTDGSQSRLTFTVDNWNQLQRVTVTGVNDAIDNAGDARTVTIDHIITAGDGGDYTNAREIGSVAVTVADDDTAGVAVSEDTVTIAEADGALIYTINLTSRPAGNVQITATSAEPTSVMLQTGGPVILSFTSNNWNQPQTVTATAVDDDIDNDDTRTVRIGHVITTGDGDGYPRNGLNPASVTVMLTDDDTAGVNISEEAIMVEEGNGATTDSYTIVLTSQPVSDVEIMVNSGDPSALLIQAPAGSIGLTFTSANWDQPQRVTAMSVNNAIDDIDVRVVNIRHSISTAASGGYPSSRMIAPVTVTVTDDEADAALVFSRHTISVIEETNQSYTVRLTSQPTANVTVTVSATGLTVDTDMGTDGNQNRLIFTDINWNTAQTVTITAESDPDSDDNNTSLMHTAMGGDYDGLTGSVAVSIIDDDKNAGVTIEQTGITITEGQTGGYTVELDAQPDSSIVIMVDSDINAIAAVTPTTLTFSTTNWSIPQRITVTGVNDDIDNAGDARTATISHIITTGDSGGYTPTSPTIDTVTVTVTDNDQAELIFGQDTLPVIENGASGLYAVTLATMPTGEVNIVISGQAGTDLTIDTDPDTAGNQDTLIFTPINWNNPQTVTVTAGMDNDRDDDSVTLTHRASNGGYDRVTGTVVVNVTDDDKDTGVSINRANVTVGEGGTASYTVVLDKQPTSGETVTITMASAMTTVATVTPTTLTFSTANWSIRQRITVTGVQDNIDNGERRITVTHNISSSLGGSAAYNILPAQTVTVTVTDDDEAGLIFGQLSGPNRISVIEDSDSSAYTVNLATIPTANVTVTITGNAGTDLALSDNQLIFMVTNWDQPQEILVTANSDPDSNNDRVTLTHTAEGGGYDTVAEAIAVNIADDESMTAGVTTSPSAIRVNENGGIASYTVVLDAPPMANVVITVASSDEDVMTVSPTSLIFTPLNWGIEQAVTVIGIDDGTDTPVSRTATSRHAIANNGGDGAGYPDDGSLMIDPVAVTVTSAAQLTTNNTLTAQEMEMQTAQQTWLPRFGLTAMQHVLSGLNYRFSVVDPPPGLSGNLNGLPNISHAPMAKANLRGLGADGFGHGHTNKDGFGAGSVDRLFNLSRSWSLSLQNMLRGSHFMYSDKDSVSIWGRVLYSQYEDKADGVLVTGDVTTGILGVDSDNGRTLTGMALSYSDGKSDWKGTLGQGKLTSTLTSLIPYIQHTVADRLQVWAAAGYGRGDLKQTSTTSADTRQSLEQISASAGLRGTLLEHPGLTLALISDATLVYNKLHDSIHASGMETNIRRLRMGLEWSWQLPQEDGGRLIPRLELGVLHDDGDTQGGLGTELGGGVSWESPSRGLTLELLARRLLHHQASARREWGLSGALRLDTRPDSAHGLSLSLHQEYGNAPASGGLDRLLSGTLSDSLTDNPSEPGAIARRWKLNGEWGLALDNGATGIPYAGLSSSGSQRELSLGLRLLSISGGLRKELDMRAVQQQESNGKANHKIGAEMKLSW